MESTHTEERHHLVAAHRICPDRPYVELTIPSDALSVVWVEFHATTHDQGWMDNKPEREVPTWTYMDSSVRRPFGRNDLRPFRELWNRGAEPDFCLHTVKWDVNSCSSQRKLWIESLQPEDVIQLTPKASFMGWINFVRCARISIGYISSRNSQNDSARITSRLAEDRTRNSYLRALDVNVKEIRVLVVEPGKPGGQLYCEFRYQQLMGGPQFQALSYCWQDTGTPSKLWIRNTVTGSDITYYPREISSTVAGALQRLRHEHESIVIWIDQLCINQQDLDERASQVSMMADIYSAASQVDIWLGKGDTESYLSLSLIRDIYNYQYGFCAGGEACKCNGTAHSLQPKDVRHSLAQHKIDGSNPLAILRHMFSHQFSQWNTDAVLGINGQSPEVSYTMGSLFSRPWFRRVWVLQEALRAQCAWVHCGEYTAPWEELLSVSGWLDSEAAFHPERVTMPSIWFNSAMGINTNKSDGAAAHQQNRLPFLDIFLHGLNMRASDPRDKIFALLSFGIDTNNVPSLSPLIRPSYTKSVSKVFADFTRWWIITYKSLSILSAITRSQHGRTWQPLHDDTSPRLAGHLALPTWALGIDGQRNWTDLWTLDPHFSDEFNFRASGVSAPDHALLETNSLSGPEVLRLHGFKITDIRIISYLEFSATSDMSVDSSLEELISIFLGLLDPAGYYKLTRKGHSTGNNAEFPPQLRSNKWPHWHSQLRDHCTAHWHPCYHSPLPPRLPAYKLESLLSENYDYIACQTATIPRCLDPFFFIASNKMYGLCPKPAKKGDIVVVLHGGKVPYLLRPIPDRGDSMVADPADSTENFEFVGECYVKGIMHGEYFEKQVNDGRQPDVFTIL